MKKQHMIVALAVLLATSITSCRTAYQKVASDTHRDTNELLLLNRACREEFPIMNRVVPGIITRKDTSFVYDEEAITELNAIIDSLLVLDESNRERLRMRADSITHLLWEHSKTPCVTTFRVDTVYRTDSASLYRAFEERTALMEENVRLKGEVVSMGMERDAAREDKKEAQDQNHQLWFWLILTIVAFAVYVFRKPLLRGIIAIFNPVKI